MDSVDKWLNSNINPSVDKTDDFYLLPDQIQYHGDHSMNEYNMYYSQNDSDIMNNNLLMIRNILDELKTTGLLRKCKQDTQKLLKYLEFYKNNNVDEIILIYPSTIRSHANFLFKQMIDTVLENDLSIILPSVSVSIIRGEKQIVIKNIKFNVFNINNKNDFYKFCYLNSTTQKGNIVDYSGHLLDKNIKHENNVLLNSYDNLTMESVSDLLKNINEQEFIYRDNIHSLWNNVIEKYIENRETRQILNKLYYDNYSSDNFKIFVKFMNSLDIYHIMINIKNKLTDLTIQVT